MATLSDIALYINADELAVQGMLEVLIRRGEISLGQKAPSCGSSCSQCDQSGTAQYFWGDGQNCPNADATSTLGGVEIS